MHRFYVPQKISTGQIDISDAEQLHHLRDVLRLKPGDEVSVFDKAGNEYLADISEINKHRATLEIKSHRPSKNRKLKVAIACAIPKKSGMDEIVDKLTQLDIDIIIPLVTERVIVKIESKEDHKLERWKKIALNAAEQSHRNTLPVVTPIMNFSEILATSADYQTKLIPTLAGGGKPLREVFAKLNPTGILVVVGPEGDFAQAEIKQAIKAGFNPVSLGDTTLRVETAAIAIASYIRLSLMS